MASVIAVMARHPHRAEVKTRLGARLAAPARAELYEAFLRDTVAHVRGVAEVSHAIVHTPVSDADWFRGLGGHGTRVLAQRGEGLGERIRAAFDDLFARYARVLLVGSDAPDLPAAYLRDGARALAAGAPLVLGPAEDGGYYAIGLARPAPDLFTDIEWSTSRTRSQTLDRAAALGLAVTTLAPWWDVDEPPDLDRLVHRLAACDGATAPATWATLRGLLERDPSTPRSP